MAQTLSTDQLREWTDDAFAELAHAIKIEQERRFRLR
jgi:hypothetical protein